MADLDLADEWARISHTKPEEKDEVRAVRGLFGMYDRLYVKRSLAHKIAFAALALQTIEWLNEGASDQLRPLMLREDLRKALAFAGAASSDQNIDRVLATIANDLSILGHRRGTQSGVRGVYAIEPAACTVTIRGARRVMYLAGPSALDRGEGDQRDELFLQPRYLDTVPASAVPSVFAFDPTPFEFVVFSCTLQRHVQGSVDEACTDMLGLFMALPLMLHGAAGALQGDGVATTYPYLEEWSTSAKFGCVSCVEAEPLAFARTKKGADVCEVHGRVLTHPVASTSSLEPLLAAWPAGLLREIGLNLQVPFPEDAGSDYVSEVFDPKLVSVTLGELARVGPILRRDALLGDVVKISANAEMGVWIYAGCILVRFWATDNAAVLDEIASFSLNDFLQGVLRRFASSKNDSAFPSGKSSRKMRPAPTRSKPTKKPK